MIKTVWRIQWFKGNRFTTDKKELMLLHKKRGLRAIQYPVYITERKVLIK